MDIAFFNFGWMAINVILSILPVIFINLFIKVNHKIFKGLFFILWFLFIPNSIYLLTDLQYLPQQLSRAEILPNLILISQYIVLVIFGIVTYLYSIKPVIRIIRKRFRKLKQKEIDIGVIVFNFIISFGVILGKVQRTESWHLFTQPIRVITDIERTLHAPGLLLSIILFGVMINIIYFAKEKI
jgi:uncharacterized membrane protein